MKKLFLKAASIFALMGVSLNSAQAIQSHSLKMPENATWYAAGTLALLGASYGLYKGVPLIWSSIKSHYNQHVINKATAILDRLSSQDMNRFSFSLYGTKPIVEKAINLIAPKLKDEDAEQLNSDFTRMYAKIRQVESERTRDLEQAQLTIQQNAKAINRRFRRAGSF